MKLWEYPCKKVKLIDVDGKEWVGYCVEYTQALDGDNNIASITVTTSEGGICFYENEIKSIEEIKDDKR